MLYNVLLNYTSVLNNICNVVSDSDPFMIFTHSLKNIHLNLFSQSWLHHKHLGSSLKNMRPHSRPIKSKLIGMWILVLKTQQPNCLSR